jgi:hypothetical protein
MLVMDAYAADECMVQPTSITTASIRSNTAGFTVEIDPGTIEEIRRRVEEGFNSFAHGGLEVGGVLYGIRERKHILVTSHAELPCEHARGPGFLLSQADEAALASLKRDGAGLEPGTARIRAATCSSTSTTARCSRAIFRSPEASLS